MPHTAGTWSRERALIAGAKGRANRAKNYAAARQRLKRLVSVASDPPAKLPSLLREQIAGASLHLESAQREGKTKQLKEWILIVRRLVELERFVSSPPSTRASSISSPAKFLPPPSPPAAGAPSKDTSKDQVDQVEPFPTEPLD